ncbi:MAG: hypothetical protein GXP53_03915 [Deltaproteobacteria bacterium]|nr:hypothetical protein [Deltaproteobacteria bacterium]
MKKPKKLKKISNKGFRGYPVATISYYGPDNKIATKVAVGIVAGENEMPRDLKRWFKDSEIRNDLMVQDAILEFIRQNKVKSVVIADRIMGCPHEEGKDYPDGSKCPKCHYWANRDRFSGEINKRHI